MKAGVIVGATAVGLLTSAIGFAQLVKRPSPDQLAVSYREGLMTVINGNAMPLALMGRGRAPYNAAVVRKNAARLAFLVTMIPDAFERDTSKATGIKTKALPKIWQKKASFLNNASELKQAVDQLETEIKSGDNESTIKMGINNVGSSCGNCHMSFRKS